MADVLRECGHPVWAVDLYRRCLRDLGAVAGDQFLCSAVTEGLEQALRSV